MHCFYFLFDLGVFQIMDGAVAAIVGANVEIFGECSH